MAHSTAPILIIGAGIAGLTLAQGLRLNSIPFRLFERHTQSHSSQGHRFRIQRPSVEELTSILSPQCKDLFQRTAAESHRFQPRFVDAKVFEFEAPVPIENPQSMPVDRTWLRQLLTLGIEDSIEYSKEFVSYEIQEGSDSVTVSFADGTSATGRLLVGADGIKSHVRKQLQPSRKLLALERWIMWGRTLLTPSLRSQLSDDHLTWFMALDKEANVQAIVEPMIWRQSVAEGSGGQLPDFQDYLYWAFSTDPGSGDPPRTAADRKAHLDRVTQAFHPKLKLIFDEASYDLSACVLVMSSKPDIELPAPSPPTSPRSGGTEVKVTLLGDAAHAMSPMGGSGADTAIANAVDLAATLKRGESVEAFEGRMHERAKEKIEHSFRGGQRFWRGKEWEEYKEVDI